MKIESDFNDFWYWIGEDNYSDSDADEFPVGYYLGSPRKSNMEIPGPPGKVYEKKVYLYVTTIHEFWFNAPTISNWILI